MATPRKPTARRGRPPKFRPDADVLLPVGDVAEILGLDATQLTKCLDRAPLSFFSGAQQQGSQWYIPAASLKPWMLSGEYPLLTKAKAARALSISRAEIDTLIRTKRLEHIILPGNKVRIKPKALASLQRQVPAVSFFSGGKPRE